MTGSASLFDPPAKGVLENAVGWINAVLLGELAVGLCVLAVAILGMLMLTGRLPLRQGGHVILGCFVLLGAPIIAAQIVGISQERRHYVVLPQPIVSEVLPPREDLPQANYNPYASATMRED